ncbi:MAG: MMPL family transporter, partial [Dehalococcoidia bacterium]|nr:MMPL family transporter [Dehalococcoidia bacterium]
SESLKAIEIPVGPAEVVGLAVAAVVLVLTLGSLVAAGLPLLTALVGVGIGVGTAFALSTSVEMNNATPVLALMVGLAVGIDYALFVVNRQRRLIIDRGLEAREAAGRAVGTAGSAVFFAGLTVLVALVALTVIGISLLTTMALVAASTVLLAVLIALTLLPALLGLIGERIVSAKARQKG